MDSHDNEDYWSSSARKAFSFEEDGDVIDNNSLPSSRSIDVFNDDTISEASLSFESSPGAAINFTIKSLISEEVLSSILQEQSLDEYIITKGCPLEEELKILRRQIQNTIYSPTAEVTALKLLQGKNPLLEAFKSLQEKEQLLDAMYQNGGGDAIVSILLFLKRSLNRENFYQILRNQRTDALEHYISFIKLCNNCEDEVISLLRDFGRHQEALVIEFQTAMSCQDVQLKKRKLKALLDQCSSGIYNVNGLYSIIVHSTIKILDLIEKEHNALGNMVSSDSTPIEVLYACCEKHNWKDQDITNSISPFRFTAEQQISPALFEWVALNERTSSQAYADLENIFERVSAWHPMKQKQFHISFSLETAILRLHYLQAPSTVLYLFLSKISNSNEKLELSKRVNCKKAIVDALASLKDINQLTQFRDSLPDRSEEQFYCNKALKNLQSKRWTADSIKLKL